MKKFVALTLFAVAACLFVVESAEAGLRDRGCCGVRERVSKKCNGLQLGSRLRERLNSCCR